MTVLVLAAARFEAQKTLDLLNEKNISYEFFELGIGPINASRNFYSLKEKCLAKNVLYLGTCGTFSEFKTIEIFQATTVYWQPACVRTSLASFNPKWHPPIKLKENKNINLKKKIVLTSPSISLSSKISPTLNLPARENLVENMELYCVSEALNQANSLTTVLALTNACSFEGRKKWQENHQEASKLSMLKIKDFLSQGLLEL